MPYRLIYVGLGLLAIGAIAFAVAFGKSGEPVELPPPIESLTPAPGDAVLRQTILEVDLAAGYRAAIFVDGFRLPDNEVVFVDGTGVHRWAPSPVSAYLDEWAPGEHTVLIRWDTLAGLPDAGEFEWTFRVQ